MVGRDILIEINDMLNLIVLIQCLIMIESGGNPDAIGDNGKAIGILQIHQCVVDDVNRIYKTDYSWPDDCFDESKSREICEKYITFWMNHRGLVSAKDAARIWNGGPVGHRLESTEDYGTRVYNLYKEYTK